MRQLGLQALFGGKPAWVLCGRGAASCAAGMRGPLELQASCGGEAARRLHSCWTALGAQRMLSGRQCVRLVAVAGPVAPHAVTPQQGAWSCRPVWLLALACHVWHDSKDIWPGAASAWPWHGARLSIGVAQSCSGQAFRLEVHYMLLNGHPLEASPTCRPARHTVRL